MKIAPLFIATAITYFAVIICFNLKSEGLIKPVAAKQFDSLCVA